MAQLKDIAELTGVSLSAVSRVLRNKMGNVGIAHEKRIEIEAVAKRLNYTPNRIARSMVERKSYAIGVVCTFLPDNKNSYEKADAQSFFYGVLSGVQQVCQEHDYNCVFTVCDESKFDRFIFPKSLSDGSLDGVILVGYTSSAIFNKLNELKIPFVHLGNNYKSDIQVPTICADIAGATADVIRYYKTLNHKVIHVVMSGGPGPEQIRSEVLSNVKDECIDVEFSLGNDLQPSEQYYYDCGRRLGLSKGGATGIILLNTKWGSFLHGMLSTGKKCPEDFSLFVATSNFAFTELEVPFPISSIVLPQYKVGTLAATELLNMIEVRQDTNNEMSKLVPCVIKMGKTCSYINLD